MFPDYPDHLITSDPRSPYYDDSNDDLLEMSIEALEEELSNIESAIEELPRNHRTRRSYERADAIRQELKSRTRRYKYG